MFRRCSDDAAVFSAYSTALRKLAAEVITGDLLTTLKTEEQRQTRILRKEFLLLADFPFEALVNRAKMLLKIDDENLCLRRDTPPGPPDHYPAIIRAGIMNGGADSVMELVNAVRHAIQIDECRWVTDGGIMPLDTDTPILINVYWRRYFVSGDGEIRVTVDSRQAVYDQRFKPYPNVKFAHQPDYIIVEVKSARENQAAIPSLVKALPLRLSRHSKYVAGVDSISGF